MATIVDRQYNLPLDPDLRLSIFNEQIARTINVGSNWNWLRVGVRMCQSGSGLPAGASFAMGLCSGTSSLYKDNIVHFIGSDLDTASAWSGDIAGRGVNWALTGGRIVAKVSSSIFNVTSGSQKLWAITGTQITGSQHRSYYMIDFIKGSGDPSLWNIVWVWNATPFLASYKDDMSISNFNNEMQHLTASINLINWTSGPDSGLAFTRSYFSVPVSESINGMLDTVNIYWSSSTTPLEISDIQVCQFS